MACARRALSVPLVRGQNTQLVIYNCCLGRVNFVCVVFILFSCIFCFCCCCFVPFFFLFFLRHVKVHFGLGHDGASEKPGLVWPVPNLFRMSPGDRPLPIRPRLLAFFFASLSLYTSFHILYIFFCCCSLLFSVSFLCSSSFFFIIIIGATLTSRRRMYPRTEIEFNII